MCSTDTPSEKSAKCGDRVTLSFNVQLQDQFTSRWYLNDKPISHETPDYEGSLPNTLDIRECLSVHEGSYKCIVTNNALSSITYYSTELNLGM